MRMPRRDNYGTIKVPSRQFNQLEVVRMADK